MKMTIDSVANGTANLIWAIFGGLVFAICYWFAAIVYSITIIGIPFGVQLFKLGNMMIHPFGYSIEDSEGIGSGCISLLLNIIWIFCGGIELCLLHLCCGLLFCITIVGIPFGLKHFQIAWLALFPFGKSIEADKY